MNLFQVTKKQEGGGLELQTFTGNPVTFTPSYSEALPAPFNGTNLKVAIVASGGNGTPATPIPIVGHSELNLVRCGKNFLDYENADRISTGATYSGGVYSYPQQYAVVEWDIPVKPGNYVASVNITEINGSTMCLEISNNDGTAFDIRSYITTTGTSSKTFTVTDQSSVKVSIWCSIYSGTSKITSCQIELGSSSSPYAPYNGTPYLVSFGQTVYGGVYDANAGKVTITHVLFEKAVADMNNYDDFPGWNNCGARAILETEGVYTVNGNVGNTFGTNFIGNNDVLFLPRASYGGLTQTQWMTNYPDLVVQFVMPLGTPIEIDVSELSVYTIVGVNNITSDGGGDITVTCLI